MSLAAAPQNQSSTLIEESVEHDTMPGAHFAGLLKPEVAAIVPKALTEPIDAGSVDEEDEGGGSHRDRADRAALKAIVSKRVLAARLMNGLSQTEAAELLKYGTPAQLSQWEQCRRPVPLHMLMRASAVYQVSMDYLTGVSSDPERDVRTVRHNATVRTVRATLVGAVERVVSAINSGEGVVALNVGTVRQLVAAAEAVTATYSDLVQQRHASRIAERLASAIEHLEDTALKAGIAIRRHDDEDALMRQRLAEFAANDAG